MTSPTDDCVDSISLRAVGSVRGGRPPSVRAVALLALYDLSGPASVHDGRVPNLSRIKPEDGCPVVTCLIRLEGKRPGAVARDDARQNACIFRVARRSTVAEIPVASSAHDRRKIFQGECPPFTKGFQRKRPLSSLFDHSGPTCPSAAAVAPFWTRRSNTSGGGRARPRPNLSRHRPACPEFPCCCSRRG